MSRGLEDHANLREWLYLESDGELTAAQRSRLREHVQRCRECQDEQRQLQALERLLVESRVPVRRGLRHDIMAGLPAAGWEARLRRNWLVALSIALALAVASAVLIGTGAAELSDAVPVAATLAVLDLLRSSALAGAGLIGATWKGLGLALQQVLGESVWNLIGFGAVIVCVDIVLLRFLLRRRAADIEAERARQPTSPHR